MGTIANLKVNIGGDADQLISEMKRVEKSLKDSEKSFSDFGGKAAKAIGAIGTAIAASNVAGKIISVSAEFETLRASLETVFGSQEAAALQFKKINDFASSTPFTIQQITEATIRMKSLGLDPSIESLRSMGNTASALGKPLMQFTEAVADAVVGEFERLKEFGIKARSEGDKVKFTFQGITTEIGKNADEINEYLLSIGKTEFAGAIEKQADTLSGVFSTLEGSLDSLAVKFAEESGLAGAVKEATKALTEFINTRFLLEPTIQSVGDEIAALEEKINNASGSGRNRGMGRMTTQLRDLRAEMVELKKEDALKFILSDIGKALEPPEIMPISDNAKSKEESEKDKQNRINEAWEKVKRNAEKNRKEEVKINKGADKEIVENDEEKFRKLISNASTSSRAIFEINKVLAISDAILGAKESVLGAYKVGSKIGGPPLGAAFAAAAGVATASLVASIASSSFGGVGGDQATASSGAVPVAQDTQDAISGAANDEPQNKTVFINVEGIDDEAFLTKNQVRSIVDQINEERDANVRIVL